MVENMPADSEFCPHLSKFEQLLPPTHSDVIFDMAVVHPKEPLITVKSVPSTQFKSLLQRFISLVNANQFQPGPPNWKRIEYSLEKDLAEF